MDRSQEIIKVSIQGILVNMFLVISKAVIALISGSLAIFLDALNNLSDAISSVIIIIGTKLSKRPRDKAHPYGFGRIEYLTSLVLGLLIMFTGYQALVESINRIIHPTNPSYSWPSYVVLVIAILTKYFFGKYLLKQGDRLDALTLSAAGTDARMDALVSLSTLAAAIIHSVLGINLDGFLGLFIAVLIIKAGYDVIKEGTSSIIGNRLDHELSVKITDRIREIPEVLGAYDLILHDYGPDMMMGAVHVEISDQLTARQIDQLCRKIAHICYSEFAVLLTVGIYASNCTNDEDFLLEEEIRTYVFNQPGVLQIHGFYIDHSKDRIEFDIVYDYSLKDPDKARKEIEKELAKRFPPYHFIIVMDFDYSLSE